MLEGFLALPIWLIALISIGVPIVIVIPVVKAIFNRFLEGAVRLARRLLPRGASFRRAQDLRP